MEILAIERLNNKTQLVLDRSNIKMMRFYYNMIVDQSFESLVSKQCSNNQVVHGHLTQITLCADTVTAGEIKS